MGNRIFGFGHRPCGPYLKALWGGHIYTAAICGSGHKPGDSTTVTVTVTDPDMRFLCPGGRGGWVLPSSIELLTENGKKQTLLTFFPHIFQILGLATVINQDVNQIINFLFGLGDSFDSWQGGWNMILPMI